MKESTPSMMTGGYGFADDKSDTPINNVVSTKSLKTKLYGHLAQFADGTTLHGCKQTQNVQKPSLFRYVWIFILISMFVALGTSLALLWIRYTSYPFRTVWKMSREEYITLPEITICLQGEFDTDKTDSWEDATEYLRNRWIPWAVPNSNKFAQLPFSEAMDRFGFDTKDVFFDRFFIRSCRIKRAPS